MGIVLEPRKLYKEKHAISSKSMAHRYLIASALSKTNTIIECNEMSLDIEATILCLKEMGAEINVSDGMIFVKPIDIKKERNKNRNIELHCKESGSTLRFLIPLVGAIGIEGKFFPEGRLPKRPLAPLDSQLREKGMEIGEIGSIPYCVKGPLQPGIFSLPGDVSSQYITGLLFSLPLLNGDSEIQLTTKLQSKSYIDLTMDVLDKCGIEIDWYDNIFHIKGNQNYNCPKKVIVEGDWSNGAFWLCAGALSEEGLFVRNLDINSKQGDRKVIDVLKEFGADIQIQDTGIMVKGQDLKAIEIDAENIPDLVPILSLVAVKAKGTTKVINAGRLRIKESDRIETTVKLINSLGGVAKELDEGMEIIGTGELVGGKVSSFNDHRIAMMAGIASTISKENIELTGEEAVQKSYPNFWKDLIEV